MKIRILDRYLLMNWLRMYAVCQAGFMVTYLVIDVLEKFSRFSRSGVSGIDMAGYFLLKLPEMFDNTAGFAVLMATILALGALSRSSELTAMRSCGVSIARLAAPVVVGGALVSVVMFLNAELVIPSSYKQMDYIEKIKIKKQDRGTLFKLTNIWFKFDRMMLHAESFDPQNVTLRTVTVWELSPQMKPVTRIDAVRAVQEPGGQWVLQDAVVRSFAGSAPLRKETRVPIALTLNREDLRVYDKNADNLSMLTLYRYTAMLERSGYDAGRFRTLMHAKLANPCAAMVMVILGLPFALKTGRSGGAARGVAFAVALGFGYFVINALILSYGKGSVLPAVVAAWGANLLFACAGIWLSMTVRQQ